MNLERDTVRLLLICAASCAILYVLGQFRRFDSDDSPTPITEEPTELQKMDFENYKDSARLDSLDRISKQIRYK